MAAEKKARKLFQITVAEPDYYQDFRCIAADCRHNCCEHFWRITVDKSTYKKYQSVKGASKELTDALRNYVKRDKESKNDMTYGYFLYLTNPQRCAFQTKDRLCMIQRELGEEYLCNTCQVYPRHFSRIFPVDSDRSFLERGCDVSCEALPLMFLHREEPIQIVSDTVTVNQNHKRKLIPNVNNLLYEQDRPLIAHIFSIQTYAIAVLQDRDYPLEHRLILLTWLFYKLNEFEKANKIDQVPMLLDTFAQGVNDHIFDKLFAIDSEIPFGDVMSGYLSAVSFFPEANNDETALKLYKIMKKLVAGENSESRRNAFEKILRSREIYIEHILVNQLFVELFPFHANKDIWECAKLFVGSYLILRFIISVYAGEQESLSDIELIDLTAYWGKSLLHGKDKLMQVVEMFEKNGFDSVAHMAVLIKS